MTREFSDAEVVPGTRYRVLGQLGEGGMGTVYLVEHTELGKRFVLKSLFSELQTRKDLVGRLRQEWRALGRLNHPNIVNVSDAGTSTSGVPYYVMEYVEGESLLDALSREHALPIPRAVAIATSVLEALSAAHAIGIVHRDVKPPNIFLTKNGEVKLLDFGVAKLADQDAEVVTARGIAIGTPRYMSPEQAKGHAIDGRADLYALGLVLFETIAGQGPFDDARDANELLLSHITKPAPRLTQFHRGVAPELAELVASLLAKDPVDRPASARQVAAALRALKPSTASSTSIAHLDTELAPSFVTPPSDTPGSERSAPTMRLDLESSPSPDLLPTRTAAPFHSVPPPSLTPMPSDSTTLPRGTLGSKRALPIWIYLAGGVAALTAIGLIALLFGMRSQSKPESGASAPVAPEPASAVRAPEPEPTPKPSITEREPEPKPIAKESVAVKTTTPKAREPTQPAAPRAPAPQPKPKATSTSRPLPASGL